jgi:hypothetical protein
VQYVLVDVVFFNALSLEELGDQINNGRKKQPQEKNVKGLRIKRHKAQDRQRENKIAFCNAGHGDEFIDGNKGNECQEDKEPFCRQEIKEGNNNGR